MKVLIIGSGGREHALTWKFAESPSVAEIYCAPGNAGTAQLARNIAIKADDILGLAAWAEDAGIDLTIAGPEAPLVEGIWDVFATRGMKVFGPSKEAAQLEGSKSFAKCLMEKYEIPTGKAQFFQDVEAAGKYLNGLEPPYVIKADGLAAGKGVSIAPSILLAEEALHECLMEKRFGAAGDTVLVEEFLDGPEVSLIAFTDGKRVIPLAPAQDYKRVGDGDTGPNTGGMGSYSPVPVLDSATHDHVVKTVLERTVEALAAEGLVYRGILYAGLVLTPGGPKVLEFNVRFGDPETQAILPRMKSDIAQLTLAAAEGDLGELAIEWDERCCVTVTLASAGYPGEYHIGLPISGLEAAAAVPGATVFHAGTALKDGQVVTAGGRVLNITGLGKDFAEARAVAYEAAGKISFEGVYYRTDIGLRVSG